MIPTATAAPGPAARESAGYAGASPSRPPHTGPAGDHTIAGQTQPAATANPGVQAGTTGEPGGTSGGVLARALPGAANVLASSPGLARNRLISARCCTCSAAAAPACRCCA